MQGDELRALRKAEKGVTMGDLAGDLGITAAYLGELERGEKTIDPRTALAAQVAIAKRTIARLAADPAMAGALTALKADLLDRIIASI